MQTNSKPLRHPTTRSQKLALILFGIFAAIMLLAAIEIVLRWRGVGENDLFEDPYVGFEGSASLFERHTDGSGRERFATRTAKLSHFNAQSFAAVKPEGTTRVFVLGGSTTFGRPYDDRVSFSNWLRVLLAEAEPDRSFEVINAGGVSYASYRIVRLMRELKDYEPDLFVIYTGHNEFLEDRTYPELLGATPMLKWSKSRLGELRLYRVLHDAISRGKAETPSRQNLTDEVRARLDTWQGLQAFERDDSWQEGVRAHFRLNLQRMIAIARRMGARVMLITSASNLADFSPFKSQHDANLATADRQRFNQLLETGRTRLDAGAAVSAWPLLQDALSLDSRFADLHFLLGRTARALGRNPQAADHFRRAKDTDVCPLRCLDVMIEAMRTIAADASVPVVDLVARLEHESRDHTGLAAPGDAFFLDHVHPTVAVHQMIAEMVFERMNELDLVAAPLPSRQKREAGYAAVLDGLDQSYYGRRDLNLAKVLGWAGKIEAALTAVRRAREKLPEEAEVHYNEGMLLEKLEQAGSRTAALEAYRQAVRLDPTFFEAWLNGGRVLQALARHGEAISAFERCLAIQPDLHEARLELAESLLAENRAEEALIELRRLQAQDVNFAGLDDLLSRALAASGDDEAAHKLLLDRIANDPDDADAQHSLAMLLARSGDMAGARTHFQRVAELNPNDASAFRNLARAHQRVGDVDAAMTAFERSLSLDPHNGEALLDLAALAARTNRFEKAIAAYRRALQVFPPTAATYNDLAITYHRAQQPGQAIEALRQAVELDPDHADYHYNLAQLLAVNGAPEDAAHHLKRAMNLGREADPALVRALQPYLP